MNVMKFSKFKRVSLPLIVTGIVLTIIFLIIVKTNLLNSLLSPFCPFRPQMQSDGFCRVLLEVNYKNSPEAAQKIYQFGVPHTDRLGRSLFTYDSQSSFFPIWMYGMKHPRTGYLCHPDESTKAWISEHIPRVSNLELLKMAGFNTAQFMGEADSATYFLREAKRLKMQALMYFKPLNQGLAQEAGIREFMRANGNHSSVLGWIPTEETGHYLTLYKDVKRPAISDWISLFNKTRGEIKNLSPRPVFLLDNLWLSNQTELPETDADLKTWRAWNDGSEIIALDNYPLNLASLNSFDYSNGLTRGADFVIRTYKQKKPYWIMLNAYEAVPTIGQNKNAQFPSPQQIRAMVYMSIVSGATGIGYFLIDDYASRKSQLVGVRPDTPTKYLNSGQCEGKNWADMLQISEQKAQESRILWQSISKINFELQELTPVILSKTSSLNYGVKFSRTGVSESPIRTILKEHNGYFYLFAVNLDRAKIYTKFDLRNHRSKDVEVLFENRRFPVKAGSSKMEIHDEFIDFAVHIYRWLK